VSGNRFNAYSELGIGIGLRAPHVDTILKAKPEVSWFEVISENFMLDGGRPLHVLDRMLESYPLVQHGVGLYLGSADRPSADYLRRLKELLRRTRAPWVSDHLCWGSVDGTVSHDLLPLPYTMDTARHFASRIREAQDFLEVPFVVENLSSYVEFKESTMSEWEFVSEVAEQADCGLLLDVNNVYVSALNHGFDPLTYIESVPHERVAQMHIAGHSRYERMAIDTHDHPVVDPVWELYGRAIELCGPTPTLLEWDARIPPFEEVHAEAMKAARYWDTEAAETRHAA
jgi:uncharacterized protein